MPPWEGKYLLPHHHLPLTEWGPAGFWEAGALSAWLLPKGAQKGCASPGKGVTLGQRPTREEIPKHPSFEHKSTQPCS